MTRRAVLLWWLPVAFALALGAAADTVSPPPGPTMGTLAGTFDVSLAGAATYQIPIKVAPGTAGMRPAISLIYSSQSVGGSLGVGWSVSGFSTITRGARNARDDKIPDGIRLAESDALYLDGQRLVAISASGSGVGRTIEYRKQLDDETRIIETGADFGSARFDVATKGGVRITFDVLPSGSDDENRGDIRFADGTVLLRAETRAEDTSGNFIDFYYKVNHNGNFDIKTIRYTGHRDPTAADPRVQAPYAQVTFDYGAAPRLLRNYIAGHALVVDTRLTSIISTVAEKPLDPSHSNWDQVAKYVIEYTERSDANRFVLSAVHRFGSDNREVAPTTFKYADPVVAFKDAAFSFPAIFSSHEELSAGYRFAHVSTDANQLPDVLYAIQTNGVIEAFAFKNKGTDWEALPPGLVPPIAFSTSDGKDLGVIIADIDGDGRADLLQSHSEGAGALVASTYTAGTDKWQRRPEFDLPFAVAKDGRAVARYALARWSGGPGSDLLYQSDGHSGFLRNTAAGWQADDRYKPPFDLNRPFWLVDVDCSGTPALLVSTNDSSGKAQWSVYRYGTSKWDDASAAFALPFPADTPAGAIRVISKGPSGCAQVLVATGGGIHDLFEASAGGWVHSSAGPPPFDLVDASGRESGAVVRPIANGFSTVFAHRVFADGQELQYAYFQTAAGWTTAPPNYSIPVLSDLRKAIPDRVFIGDLRGDGDVDLVMPGNSRSNFGRVYVGSDLGYVEQPDYAPPVAFARKDQKDGGVRLVDLNGDGLPDLLVSTKGGDAGAWINSGAGWSKQPALQPPVPFSGDDIAGSPVQFVDVDGDGFVDLLYSYRANGTTQARLFRNADAGAGNRKWVEVTAADADLGGLIPPASYPFAAEKVGSMGVRFADLAGTGRPYMLVGFRGPPGVAATLTAFRNDGKKWVPAPEFAPPVPFVSQISSSTDAAVDLGVQLVDVNGDGLPDIVAKYHDPQNPALVVEGVWLNTGHGFTKDPSIAVPVFLDGLTFVPGVGLQLDKNATVQWADLNGDGLVDIVYARREGGTNSSVTYISTGHGWTASAQWQLPLETLADRGGDPGIRIADVNGDGYPDILYSRTEADGSVKSGVQINNGDGWTAAIGAAVPTLPFVDKDGNDLGVRLVDVIGNGLLDLVKGYSGDSPEIAVKLNAGRRANVMEQVDAGLGVTSRISYQSLLARDNTGAGAPAAYAWSEVYRRGTDNLLYPIVAPVPSTYAVRRTQLQEGFGREIGFSYRYGGYRMDALARGALGFAWRESLNETTNVMTRLEMSQEVATAGRPLLQTTCSIDLAAKPDPAPLDPDVCSTVGDVGHTWVKMLTRIDQEWDTKEGVPSVAGATVPFRQVVLKNTSSVTYELDGLPTEWHCDHYDYDEPGSLSDRSQNVVRVFTLYGDGSSVTTANVYGADDRNAWLLGRLTETAVIKTPALPSKKTVPNGMSTHPETWYCEHYDASKLSSALPGRSNVVQVFGLAGPNRLLQDGVLYDVGDRSTWLVNGASGSAAKSPLQIGDDAAHRPHLRHVAFAYDSVTGLLVAETLNPNTSKELKTVYGRDAFGNVATRQITGVAVPLQGPTVFEFDKVGRFETSETNAMGHKTVRESDAKSGLIRSIQDPNGLQTTYEYDGEDRLRLSRSDSGSGSVVTTTIQYLAAGSVVAAYTNGTTAAYAVRTVTTSSDQEVSPKLELMDARGRTVRVVTEGFTKDAKRPRPIFVDAKYDFLGRRIGTSLPYEPGQAASWGTVQWDALGRTSREQAPDGSTTDFKYSARIAGGGKTTVTDPKRHARTLETDMRQRPVRAVDALGGAVSYEFDANDEPIIIRDAVGATTTYHYDDFGFRTDVNDPDFGHWHYVYDALGRVIKQTDAKGTDTSVEYDAIDRVTRQIDASKTWVWTYDSVPYGKGRLTGVADTAGTYSETFGYDDAGRVANTVVSTGGSSYRSERTYDSLGRVARATYPGGFAVTDEYDAKGYLIRVIDPTTKKSYWSREMTDAFGHITETALGNGVTEARSFDPTTGRPKVLKATGAAGVDLVNLRLAYDVVGNLKRRTESVQRKDEIFDYDALDRLTSLTRSNATFESYHYDAAGRFTTKSGIGTYSYGVTAPSVPCSSPKPLIRHAVSQVIGPTGTSKYEYDCSGNLIRNGSDEFAYSADNRLTGIKRQTEFSAQSVEFDYGPRGDRYREVDKKGLQVVETLTIGFYERITEFGMGVRAEQPRFVRERFYIDAADGTFAVVEHNAEMFDRDEMIFHADAGHPSSFPYNANKVWYLHKDQLGSVVAISDENGVGRARYWYDPWGERQESLNDPPPGTDPSGRRLEDSWNRGFLGQEMLRDFRLVHLNGRVYSSALGVFLSPDPMGAPGLDTQRWNPYSYARTNPLRYVDPSGLDWLGDRWHDLTAPVRAAGDALTAIGNGVGHFFNEAGKWIGENWRQIVVIAAVIAVTVLTLGSAGPGAVTLGTAILSGMAAGATGGALSAALYGGSLQDVLTGAFKGAVIGGITAGVLYGIGSAYVSGDITKFESVGAHGLVGGARDAAEGGDFWHGFTAGAVTNAADLYAPGPAGELTLNTSRAAVVGGTAAAIGGGNFTNGAITGAFSYAFNNYLHSSPEEVPARRDPPPEPSCPSGFGPILLLMPLLTGAAGWVYDTAESFFAEGGLSATEAASSSYINTTAAGASTTNITTSATAEEAAATLEGNGWKAAVSEDGQATIYTKPGAGQYVLRPSNSAPGGQALDFSPTSGSPTVKINLGGPR